jgi:hypothetical protein
MYLVSRLGQLVGMFVFTLCLFSGCTKNSNDTPEKVLDSYIQIGLNAQKDSDREKMLSLTTGEAKEELEKMSPVEFKSVFLDKKLKFIGYKTKDLRQENSGEISLIYELSYEEKDAAGAAIVTNRKIAYFSKADNGEWKIKATKNVRSVVERKEALEVLGGGASK